LILRTWNGERGLKESRLLGPEFEQENPSNKKPPKLSKDPISSPLHAKPLDCSGAQVSGLLAGQANGLAPDQSKP